MGEELEGRKRGYESKDCLREREEEDGMMIDGMKRIRNEGGI